MQKETVRTRFGKVATIELDSLAGTPYSWELTEEKEGLSHEMDVIPSKDKKAPKLKSVFKFKAKKPGTYSVDIELTDPFMSKPAEKKRFNITFH